MSDEDQPDSMREKLNSLLSGTSGGAEAADGFKIGNLRPADTVYLHFDSHEHIQIDYDGDSYEVVADADGLAVVKVDD